MKNYNSYITEELAKHLLNMGFPLSKYGINSYDGKPSFFTVDENDPNWDSSDRYKIPTYAEVLDMLLEKGFIISITPKEFVNDLEYQFEIYQFTDAGSKLILCVGIGNPNISFMDALHEAIKTTLAFVQK